MEKPLLPDGWLALTAAHQRARGPWTAASPPSLSPSPRLVYLRARAINALETDPAFPTETRVRLAGSDYYYNVSETPLAILQLLADSGR